MLSWRTITSSRNPKFSVKGTELSVALAGKNSRFAIYEIRRLDADSLPDVFYRVRDADTVSDQDVREGTRPKIVFETHDIDRAVSFIQAH